VIVATGLGLGRHKVPHHPAAQGREKIMLNFVRLSCLSSAACLALSAPGHAELAGTWELYPPQANSYETAVQQPINTDGTSNFKFNGKSVVPVKFSLSKAKGPVVFQSIFSDSGDANDFSFLSFTPAAPVLFSELTDLSAVYDFTEGDCHGGALRWSVRVSPTASVFIYYGGHPNFNDCTTAGNNQSGLNMLSFADARFDTTQVGGTFYDDLDGALALVGNQPIIRASLVLDGGWAGDQQLSPSNVTVNGNTFIPEDSAFVPTCDLPPAKIQVTKLSGVMSGPVNEPTSVQPKDDNEFFRIVDCKYMYNLATSSLLGRGRYMVEAVIGGNPVAGAAYFDLR
jgi:hypothetical protein